MEEKGVIYYCNKSKRYQSELKYSIQSLKNVSPGLKVAVFSNHFNASQNVDVIPVNDSLHPIENKVNAIISSPFRNTLFLDVDTEICKSIDDLFNKLQHGKIFMANIPNIDFSQRPPKFKGFKKQDEFNTGLILFKKDEIVDKLFAAWKEAFVRIPRSEIKLGVLDDQILFNNILKKYPEFFNAIKMLDNKIYNVRFWNFKNMNKTEKSNVVIKHWHMMPRNNIAIKVEEYYYFALRKLFGIKKEQIM